VEALRVSCLRRLVGDPAFALDRYAVAARRKTRRSRSRDVQHETWMAPHLKRA